MFVACSGVLGLRQGCLLAICAPLGVEPVLHVVQKPLPNLLSFYMLRWEGKLRRSRCAPRYVGRSVRHLVVLPVVVSPRFDLNRV